MIKKWVARAVAAVVMLAFGGASPGFADFTLGHAKHFATLAVKPPKGKKAKTVTLHSLTRHTTVRTVVPSTTRTGKVTKKVTTHTVTRTHSPKIHGHIGIGATGSLKVDHAEMIEGAIYFKDKVVTSGTNRNYTTSGTGMPTGGVQQNLDLVSAAEADVQALATFATQSSTT